VESDLRRSWANFPFDLLLLRFGISFFWTLFLWSESNTLSMLGFGCYVSICTYTHRYLHKYIHTYMCMYIHTLIHALIHTCIHTYVHTYAEAVKQIKRLRILGSLSF